MRKLNQVNNMALAIEALPSSIIQRLFSGNNSEIVPGSDTKEKSLDDPLALQEASELISSGQVIAFQFRSVSGLMVDPWNEQAAITALEVKGTLNPKEKPLSAMMFSQDFLPLVDIEKLPKSMQELVSDPDEFQNLIGAVCHIRAPIRADIVDQIPPRLLSFDDITGQAYMHNLDPQGHEPMSNFITWLNSSGLDYVGVTAIGQSGQAEFADKESALNLCRESGVVPLFLEDPNSTHEQVLGSFTQLDIENAEIIRDGHVPARVITMLVGEVSVTDEMKEVLHPQAEFFFQESLDLLKPIDLRAKLLKLMDGT